MQQIIKDSMFYAERFIRTLKIKICKYKTSKLKNVYIDELAETVNEYNNTYYITIKMKTIDPVQHIY